MMQLVQTELKQKEIPDLIPLSKFNEFLPYPTVAALRQYYFYGHKNGFINVVKRIGKRIYIDLLEKSLKKEVLKEIKIF